MKKKILAALLAALMLGGAAAVTAIAADDTPAYTVDESGNITLDVEINLIGDANGNGTVNLMDYRAVLQHVKGASLITDEYLLKCADANQNGSVNLMDYRAILQHTKGANPLW